MRIVLSVTACAFSLTGCGAEDSDGRNQVSDQPKLEAESAIGLEAMGLVADYFRANLQRFQLSEMTVSAQERAPITPADRANGVDERWCVSIAYAMKTSANSNWENRSSTVSVTRFKNKNFQFESRIVEGALYDSREIDIQSHFQKCLRGE